MTQTVRHVQQELAAMFADTFSLGGDSVEMSSSADEPFGSVSSLAANNDNVDDTEVVESGDARRDLPGIVSANNRPTQTSEGLSLEELCGRIGKLCSYGQPDAVHPQHLVNDDMEEDAFGVRRRTCSVERVLRLRDLLAVLRRRSYLAEVKQSFLRHSYTSVLLPATVRGSHQLARRSWRSVHRHRFISSLRLRGYRDYVTGWDMGS